MSSGQHMNRLYYGDCLTVMQEMVLEGVDLIYLDPPFNSKRDYNAIYKDETGRPLPDQIEAFCDQWTLDKDRERAIKKIPKWMRENGIDHEVARFWRLWVNALRNTQPRLLAYLSYMVERLLVMKTLLKPTGSIFLHCDPTASHYIKIMMDAIFGHLNLRNEIVWCYTGPGSPKMRQFNRKHDTIFWYSAGESWTFNRDLVRVPYKDPKQTLRKRMDAGRGISQEEASKYRERGKILEDYWTDIALAVRSPRERLGYPTQKPLKLLKRIIQSATNEGDVVLDPFCGCATTIEAAHALHRKWIGIDIAIHAIKRVARIRLKEKCKLVEGVHYLITGVPKTIEGAKDLWQRNPYHFQKWVVEEADGFVTNRKTADGGIDGRLYFPHPDYEELQSMIIEVKGGANVSIAHVRALRGVLDNDDALMAGLIIMRKLGPVKERNFKQFMAEAGDMEIYGRPYPKMQMRTVQEILDGKGFYTPGATGKKRKVKATEGSGQEILPLPAVQPS